MRKKILAILLGALLVATMLPVGSMAASTISVTAKDGGCFLKLDRQLSNGNMTACYFSFTPENGAEYVISYDALIPKGSNASIKFGLYEAVTRESIKLSSGSSVSGETDGWVSKSVTFTGDGNPYVFKFGAFKAAGAGIVYLDNVKFYKSAEPDVNLFPNGSFEEEFATTSVTAKVDGTNQSVSVSVPAAAFSFYKGGNSDVMNGTFSRVDSDTVVIPDVAEIFNHTFNTDNTASFANGSKNTVSRVEDPKDATNYVMKSVSTGSTHAMVIPSMTLTASQNDLLKLSFRMLIESKDLPEGKTDATFRVRISSAGSIYSGAMLTFNIFDKWVDFESYFNDTPDSAAIAAYIDGLGAYPVYIDDLKLEAFNTDGYISDLNVKASAFDSRGGSVQVFFMGEKADTISKDATYQPVAIFNPAAFDAKALAFTAIYKVEGDSRTLVDIKFKEAVTADFTTFENKSSVKAAQVAKSGILSDDLAINLDDLNLEAGTYSAECFLWSFAGLEPLGFGSKTITVE